MLVAVETFTDPTDGQPIVAGRTRVAPFADVALMFPGRFRPDPGRSRSRGIVRGGGSASVTADRPPATPLPHFYPELEPEYGVTLEYTAEQTILRDVAWTQEHLGDVETGGWLLASEHNPDYIVTATVPGSDATFTRSSINLGEEQLKAAQRRYGGDLVGCWHHHSYGTATPSKGDLRAFTAAVKLGHGTWYSLITAPSTSWRTDLELAGWVTFGSRSDMLITEPLRLVR